MSSCNSLNNLVIWKLRVCARYFGWLHSTPDFKSSKRENIPTRWEQKYGKCNFDINKLDLPINSGDYLLYALEELRPFNNDGMGISRQTWTEVANYGKIVEYLNNSELRILYELSGEWVAGFRAGKTPLSKSPLELLESKDG